MNLSKNTCSVAMFMIFGILFGSTTCDPVHEYPTTTSKTTTQETSTCVPVNCGNIFGQAVMNLIPEDEKYCAVSCCKKVTPDYICEQAFIPYINKQTGVTERMFDTTKRTFIDPPVESRLTQKSAEQTVTISRFKCPPRCGTFKQECIEFIQEDNEHCAVSCCNIASYNVQSGCAEAFIPYINKQTGVTERMFNTTKRTLINPPVESRLAQKPAEQVAVQ